jgi:hypothetical protein
VHPDRHALKHKALATRVTQELLALRPFVFPAPKPRQPAPAPRNGSPPVDPIPRKSRHRHTRPMCAAIRCRISTVINAAQNGTNAAPSRPSRNAQNSGSNTGRGKSGGGRVGRRPSARRAVPRSSSSARMLASARLAVGRRRTAVPCHG